MQQPGMLMMIIFFFTLFNKAEGLGCHLDSTPPSCSTAEKASQLLQSNVFTVGSSRVSLKTVRYRFILPFLVVPRVVVTSQGDNTTDLFALTVHSVDVNGFGLNVQNVLGKGWASLLSVSFIAWNPTAKPGPRMLWGTAKPPLLPNIEKLGVKYYNYYAPSTQITFNFTWTYPSQPVMVVSTRIGADIQGTFSASVRLLNASTAIVTVMRVDQNWNHVDVEIDWIIWSADMTLHLRKSCGTCRGVTFVQPTDELALTGPVYNAQFGTEVIPQPSANGLIYLNVPYYFKDNLLQYNFTSPPMIMVTTRTLTPQDDIFVFRVLNSSLSFFTIVGMRVGVAAGTSVNSRVYLDWMAWLPRNDDMISIVPSLVYPIIGIKESSAFFHFDVTTSNGDITLNISAAAGQSLSGITVLLSHSKPFVTRVDDAQWVLSGSASDSFKVLQVFHTDKNFRLVRHYLTVTTQLNTNYSLQLNLAQICPYIIPPQISGQLPIRSLINPGETKYFRTDLTQQQKLVQILVRQKGTNGTLSLLIAANTFPTASIALPVAASTPLDTIALEYGVSIATMTRWYSIPSSGNYFISVTHMNYTATQVEFSLEISLIIGQDPVIYRWDGLPYIGVYPDGRGLPQSPTRHSSPYNTHGRSNYLRGYGIRTCRVGFPATFDVVSVDQFGNFGPFSDDVFQAVILPPAPYLDAFNVSLVASSWGILSGTYTALHTGLHQLFVYLNNAPVRGSPFPLMAQAGTFLLANGSQTVTVPTFDYYCVFNLSKNEQDVTVIVDCGNVPIDVYISRDPEPSSNTPTQNILAFSQWETKLVQHQSPGVHSFRFFSEDGRLTYGPHYIGIHTQSPPLTCNITYTPILSPRVVNLNGQYAVDIRSTGACTSDANCTSNYRCTQNVCRNWVIFRFHLSSPVYQISFTLQPINVAQGAPDAMLMIEADNWPSLTGTWVSETNSTGVATIKISRDGVSAHPSIASSYYIAAVAYGNHTGLSHMNVTMQSLARDLSQDISPPIVAAVPTLPKTAANNATNATSSVYALSDSVTVYNQVSSGGHWEYSFPISDKSREFQCDLTRIKGECDLKIATSIPVNPPSLQWGLYYQPGLNGTQRIVVYPFDPYFISGTFYLSVLGHTPAQYSLSCTLVRSCPTVEFGGTYGGSVSFGSTKYYRIKPLTTACASLQFSLGCNNCGSSHFIQMLLLNNDFPSAATNILNVVSDVTGAITATLRIDANGQQVHPAINTVYYLALTPTAATTTPLSYVLGMQYV